MIQPQYLIYIYFLCSSSHMLRNGVYNVYLQPYHLPLLSPHWMWTERLAWCHCDYPLDISNLHLILAELTSKANHCTTWWVTTLPSNNSWTISMPVSLYLNKHRLSLSIPSKHKTSLTRTCLRSIRIYEYMELQKI